MLERMYRSPDRRIELWSLRQQVPDRRAVRGRKLHLFGSHHANLLHGRWMCGARKRQRELWRVRPRVPRHADMRQRQMWLQQPGRTNALQWCVCRHDHGHGKQRKLRRRLPRVAGLSGERLCVRVRHDQLQRHVRDLEHGHG
jgi:hypothetical protein